MKRQTRPFTVEVKRTRKLPAKPLVSRTQSASLYSRTALVRRPDVRGKFAARTASLDREVMTMIETANGPANDPTRALDDAPAEVLPPAEPSPGRVLPGLLETGSSHTQGAATDEPRPRQARTPRKPRTPKQVSKPAEQEGQAPETEHTVEAQPQPLSVPTVAARAVRRHARGGSQKLPRWKRWKERRLPPVCWR
jgi:hypothetical protein